MGFKTEVYDQVRIGVGLLAKAPTSRLLTLFGDLVHERETIVPANSLWINFYSDDTITAKGFFIRYKIIPRGLLRFHIPHNVVIMKQWNICIVFIFNDNPHSDNCFTSSSDIVYKVTCFSKTIRNRYILCELEMILLISVFTFYC